MCCAGMGSTDCVVNFITSFHGDCSSRIVKPNRENIFVINNYFKIQILQVVTVSLIFFVRDQSQSYFYDFLPIL